MKRDLKFVGKLLTGCFLVWLSSGVNVSSQTVQVAQKTVSRKISASGISKLVIGSEKADISVESWPKPEIQVTIELSARHADKSVSLKDLEKMELVVNKERKSLYLRDFILLKGKDTKPESSLKAKYTVYAPADLSLEIQNAFGTVAVRGFSSQVSLKASFCDIKMSQLSGKSNLTTSFGKLEADGISTALDVSSSHTQIILKRVEGNVRLDISHGLLRVEPGSGLSSLDLRLKKTPLDLVCPEWKKYTYSISGSYTKFRLPAGFKVISGHQEKQEIAYAGADQGSVRIWAEFGDLRIR